MAERSSQRRASAGSSGHRSRGIQRSSTGSDGQRRFTSGGPQTDVPVSTGESATASTKSKPSTGLGRLPPELLAQVISYASHARTLRDLSLASRDIHSIVEDDGWAAFVTNNFPSIEVPPLWREAAHALTTLSRNFDRRALIARDAGPFFGPEKTRLTTLPECRVTNRWHRPEGQTMGYQPVVDSHEVWTGGTWDSRREVVAWGAGAAAVIKIEERGKDWNVVDKDSRLGKRPAGPPQRWLHYRDKRFKEGLHDITAMRILDHKGTDEHGPASATLVIGRASGGMQQVKLGPNGSDVLRHYDCGTGNVQCADTNDATDKLLAACLSDSDIALFKVSGTEQVACSISRTRCVPEGEKGSRCWSSRFISRNRLAIGRGVSKRIVYVYDVRPDGISQEPVRAFSSSLNTEAARNTSAYPIEPLPGYSQGRGEGDLFWSGGYDGIIRLHDMRSPRDTVTTLHDDIDTSAIFSLATVGRERIIAGAAAHGLLKIYDLRMAGGRVYTHCKSPRDEGRDELYFGRDPWPPVHTAGTNIYTPRTGPGHRQRSRQWGQDSPVYSLSRPSPSSPKLYAGLENQVLDFNFTAILDSFPDPLFKRSMVYGRRGSFDPIQTWNRDRHAMSLSMYEQDTRAHQSPKLLYQKDIVQTGESFRDASNMDGYDERWHEVNNMRATAVLGR